MTSSEGAHSVGKTAPSGRRSLAAQAARLGRDGQLCAAARADMPRAAGGAEQKRARCCALTRARDSLWLTIPLRLLG
jgi:hypothetical protein